MTWECRETRSLDWLLFFGDLNVMPRPTAPRTDPKTLNPAPPAATPAEGPRAEGHRETVEAIVFAFILALLVRGYEAEAFVIPTGSMAPTLMGRHKEIRCPECGYVYSVNAADEVEGSSAVGPSLRRVYSGVCVNCRYQARVDDEPSYKGDRILVMKFPYEMPDLPGSARPERWDVVVFRYPEDPEISYIKRLVGLPGETLRIYHGDLFVKPPGGKTFEQARKPVEHQQAMQMMVYDDEHRASSFKSRPEWRRWINPKANTWLLDATGPGTYVADPPRDGWAELRYRHLVPDPSQWRAVEADDALPRGPRPTLVTDFYSYNTNLNADNSDLSAETSRDQEGAWLQPHWVGDLTLSARVSTEGAVGSVRFELIEGGVSNLCEINLASGEAVLSRDGGAPIGRGPSGIKGAGAYDVVFANVDNRLTLLVNGRPAFGAGVNYLDDPEHPPAPTDEDLNPARISVKGTKLRVSGLVLKRDIYYTLDPGESDYFTRWDPRRPRTPVDLFNLLADPSRVAALGPPRESVDYPIGADRFMMFGDNSPRSKDSRGWSLNDLAWDPIGRERWEVPPDAVDRQGVLRVLAARQAGLAQVPSQSGFPVPVLAVFRADEVDSLRA